MDLSDYFFEKGNLIKLRDRLETYPCLNNLPEHEFSSSDIPYYLSTLMDEMIFKNEYLLVIESYKKNLNDIPYAYQCIHKNKKVYLVSMYKSGIDPNICFVKCN